MWNSLVGEPVSIDDERLMEWLGIDPKTPRNAIGEVTYFTCLKNAFRNNGENATEIFISRPIRGKYGQIRRELHGSL